MKTFIALLRGINVSGKNIIRMKDLQELFKDAGMQDVSSYIQSGNVIFRTVKDDSSGLSALFESAIKKQFGYDVAVIIRTVKQLVDVISDSPYSSADESMQYVTFIKGKHGLTNVKKFNEENSTVDEIHLTGEHAYILIRNGYSNTKLTNSFIEKKLGVAATTRNLRTIRKLIELSKQPGD